MICRFAKNLGEGCVTMETASLPKADVMANATNIDVPDNEPQLGPKATKIRERIRNIANE